MSLQSIEMGRTAKMIVDQILAVQPGENVCIVTDTNKVAIAEELARAAHALGAETVVCVMTPRQMHGSELPTVVAGAMKAADVVVAPTTYSITHTNARKAATLAGVRVLVMRGITEDSFVHGAITADYQKVYALSDRLAGLLTAGCLVHLTSERGTDLQLSVEGRKGFIGGLARNRGDLSALPTGEAAVPPVEGSTHGVLVIEHSMDSIGLLQEPLVLKIEKGLVVKVEGGRQAGLLREVFERSGENANNIAEFAIGTNPKSRMSGNMGEDKVLLGCVHIGFGDNHTIGGQTSSSVHLDGIVLKPTVELDGHTIVASGKINLPD